MKCNTFTNQSAGLKQTTKITRNNFIKPSLVALAVAQSLSMATVEAATIHVGGAQGAGCDFNTAILSANTDSVVSGSTCVTGSGDDVIELNQDVTLTEPWQDTVNGVQEDTFFGVPLITSNITVNGNGHSISRAPSASEFGIMSARDTDSLVFNDITITNGVDSPNAPPTNFDNRRGVAIDLTLVKNLLLNNTNVSNHSGGPAISQFQDGLTIGGNASINNSVLTENDTAFDAFSSRNLNFSQSSIINNRGSGISLYGFRDLNIADSVVDNNGGGIYAGGGVIYGGGSVTISNSSISNNLGTRAALDIGSPKSVQITDSKISNNVSSGGVDIFAGYKSAGFLPVVIDNTTISNNNSSWNGGAIALTSTDRYGPLGYSRYADLTVTNSTLSGNRAARDGGAIWSDGLADGSAINHTIINSTISDNSAGHSGGGIYLGETYHYGYYGYSYKTLRKLTLINSTIVGNVATDGGGIHTNSDFKSNLNITNSMISGNSASNSGSEINHLAAITFPNDDLFQSTNNVLGSSIESNFQAFNGGFAPSSTDITATNDGNDPTALDSIVGPLQDNGGSTLTHALVAGSPAIDAGDLDTCINEPVNGLDQRGETRGADGFCDIGAYELNDGQPTISLEATRASVFEGSSGDERKIVYTINLSSPQTERVTVDYQTMDETAIGDIDYQMRAGSITFAPGQTSRIRAITVLGDDVAEPNETFKFVLSNPSGNVELDVDDAEMIGSILNDDDSNNDAPTISLEATRTSVFEGGFGDQRKIVYTINLSSPQTERVTVDYQTMDETAIGSVDYQIRDGLITFAPGQTSRIRAITVLGDDVSESDETFKFVLSNPSGNVELDVDDADATGFILNDDGGNNSLPTISLEATKSSVYEGGAGDQRKIIYTINLSSPQTEQVTVDFQTMDQTATGGVDYQIRAGSITFAPGQTSRIRTITILGDDVTEPNETFKFVLSSPSANAELDVDDADTIGTILNEDF